MKPVPILNDEFDFHACKVIELAFTGLFPNSLFKLKTEIIDRVQCIEKNFDNEIVFNKLCTNGTIDKGFSEV